MGDNLTEREIFRLTPQERTEIREARIREEEARFMALTREEKDEYLADLAALRGDHYVR